MIRFLPYLTALCFVSLSLDGLAQAHEPCAHDHAVYELNTSYPEYAEGRERLFQKAKQRAENKPYRAKSASCAYDTIFHFPVVVHILYNTAAENLPDSLVHNQIAALNRDFRRQNADSSNTRPVFKDIAADAGIEFYLAHRDPQGNPTTGITRTNTTVTSFTGGGLFPDINALNDMKRSADGGIDPWPTDKYVNIWVGNTGGNVLGLAYPPAAAPNWPAELSNSDSTVQGLIVHYEAFGMNNPSTNPMLAPEVGEGRTAVHEAGHYFGLRHIWGDGLTFLPGTVDCSVDDGLEDTPNAGNNSREAGCDPSKNTCVDTPIDFPDMFENYMDYIEESCQNAFTEDQVGIMRSMSVIGRPGLARIVTNETFTLALGDRIVLNATDTITLTDTTVVSINAGDRIEFVGANADIEYTSTVSGLVNAGAEVDVTCAKEVEDIKTGDIDTRINLLSGRAWALYPNPGQDVLRISSATVELEHIMIFDLTGRLVSETNQHVSTLDVSNLQKGVYSIKVVDSEGQMGIKQWIKQ